MPPLKFRNEPNRCLAKLHRLRCELWQGHHAAHENDGIRWAALDTETDDVETGGRL